MNLMSCRAIDIHCSSPLLTSYSDLFGCHFCYYICSFLLLFFSVFFLVMFCALFSFLLHDISLSVCVCAVKKTTKRRPKSRFYYWECEIEKEGDELYITNHQSSVIGLTLSLILSHSEFLRKKNSHKMDLSSLYTNAACR